MVWLKKVSVTALVLAGGLAVSAFKSDQVIHVHNLSGYNLRELYITPVEAQDWVWDMRATDQDGDTVAWQNLNIKASPTSTCG